MLAALVFTILFIGLVFVASVPSVGRTYDPLIGGYYDEIISEDSFYLGNFSMEQPITPDEPINHTWHLNLTIGDDPTNCEFHMLIGSGAHTSSVNATGVYRLNTTVYLNQYKALSTWFGYEFAESSELNFSLILPFGGRSHLDSADFSGLHKGRNNVTVYVTLETDFEGNITETYGYGSSETIFFHTGLGYCEAWAGPFGLLVTYIPLVARAAPYLVVGAIVVFATFVVALVALEKKREDGRLGNDAQ
jgi:hypothetical protein